MKPPNFTYARPSSVAEAVELLAAADGTAKVLAGGQSLVPAMNFRLAAPSQLIDINQIDDLAFVRREGNVLRLGAMTRMRQIELDPVVREAVPILCAAASWVGHVQIRNRGTFGGSLAHADPAAEAPAICLLLDATFTAVGPNGERRISAGDFFQGILTTALADDELLTEVTFPIMPTTESWGFREFAQRSADFALGGAAVTTRRAEGLVEDARVVVFGTASGPRRGQEIEAVLKGRRLEPTTISEAAGAIADQGGTEGSDYELELIRTLVERALQDAAAR